ncbi:MAG: TolC family protein, partial [Bacteroidetes bacterium]|nr:TolC family protein [Bacteroidota bacterium]
MKLVYSGSASLLFLILLAASQLYAQNKVAYLRVEEAVRLAIEQNLGTEVARQNQHIARRNYSWGNAGFLPSVSASAAKNWTVADENLQLNFGETINTVNRNGARSNNLNAG